MSWDDAQRNYNQIYNNPQPNESDWKHEVVAGGAAFAAMHEFEKYEEHQGKQVNHGFAKELIAGIAGAEVDKLAETHGMDWIDKEKAKHQAKEESQQLYDQSYGRQQEGGYYRDQPNQFYQGQQQQGGYQMQGNYNQGGRW
jgi:hypothetical protein